MGCSTSKLDDEEAVQLCKDRRGFIKQAVEHRIRFATDHIAYIQSLKRVSLALRNYVEGDEHRELFSNPYSSPPFTPIKKTSPEILPIPLKSLPNKPIQSETKSSFVMNYMRSGGNSSISIEERPQSPENVRIESYSPMDYSGIDGFFTMQSSSMNSSSFFSSPYNRPNFPPLSPQTSQWDFFWNPFSSLDTYGYPTHNCLDDNMARLRQVHPTRNSLDDEMASLRQVREQEGIPDLEEEEEFKNVEMREERAKVDCNCSNEAVDSDDHSEMEMGNEDIEHEVRGYQSQSTERAEVMEARNEVEVRFSKEEEVVVSERETADEMPGFTVYVNRRPTSMVEVVKDLETQFTIVCDSANEVSIMLEASRAQYSSSNANELTAVKMLNPVALFRSASSHSSSSRFFLPSSGSRDDGYDSSSDLSEESCMFSGSHQSTLDRLYAWEKKLYEEVKSGERIRIAYEKKCKQLRNQDVKGEDPPSVDKTRAAIRDLHTRIKVSIHTVESISKRIETLRDEELQPQLMELIQGLARMWRVMAECHQSQKGTIDAAKLLLAGTPPKLAQTSPSLIESHRLARSAATLESELRNWRFCFESWIGSQRSYARDLSSWFRRCARFDTDTVTDKLPFSPPIFGICIQWSKLLDTVREVPVIDGLDFFAAGLGSLYGREEEAQRSRRHGVGFSPDSGGNLAVVTEVVTEEKTAEIAIKVFCAGMSVALSSLTEFAVTSAKAYEDLVGQCQKATLPYESEKTEV